MVPPDDFTAPTQDTDLFGQPWDGPDPSWRRPLLTDDGEALPIVAFYLAFLRARMKAGLPAGSGDLPGVRSRSRSRRPSRSVAAAPPDCGGQDPPEPPPPSSFQASHREPASAEGQGPAFDGATRKVDPGSPDVRASYPPHVTTTVAAEYCGYKDASAIRKAHREGRLRPVGRRGGTGPWMWALTDLDRYLRGEPPADAIMPDALRELLANIVHNVGTWEHLSIDLVEVPSGVAPIARELAAKFALVGFFPKAPRAEIESAERLNGFLWKRTPLLEQVEPGQVGLRRPPRRMKAWQRALVRISEARAVASSGRDPFHVVKHALDHLVNRMGLPRAQVPAPFREAWERISGAACLNDLADSPTREQIEAAMLCAGMRTTVGIAGGRGKGARVSHWAWAFEFAHAFGVPMAESASAADRTRKGRN